MTKPIYLCAINNIKSGACAEDCKFCTQSIHNNSSCETYKLKPLELILNEAKLAYQSGAFGYCLVTSGKSLTSSTLHHLCEASVLLKKTIPSLNLIACNGLASLEQLKELKSAGIDSYNHNLETSKEFFSTICTTHNWDERYQTCLDIKASGLKLCCGGIYGLGESQNDRDSLLNSLSSLQPDSSPINFYHHVDGLRVENPSLISKEEALDIIKKSRSALGDSTIVMVAGGRSLIFGSDISSIYNAGANAIVIGNYLTTNGNNPHCDHSAISEAGLSIVHG